ncbi:5-methylcytosine restriction system specificity protein McrC [Gracilibacillus salinarum]|uniref:Restriction endonuclease n=1 Tax=Gracilibacillus salinarum TaxID=2932255 RepID=A0ABY4GJE4_9BACI|nr:restriction endonuclease [Gracilibacillus salinarum]UOQ83587.1 restriction endonuclease [Gracilibacillus salinarum]
MNSYGSTSNIPIKNIFYMLVYAWEHPQEKRMIPVNQKDEKDLINILARVLIDKIQSLVKRGFYREYKDFQEESGIIRGKVKFKESLNSFSFQRGKAHIEYEELSYDILHNQIIKVTLLRLLRYHNLSKENQAAIQVLLKYFQGISEVSLTASLFKEVQIHRNNYHYKFIISVCKFIFEQSLLHEDEKELSFSDFSRDHMKLAQLFEKFVKKFYYYEFPGSKARSELLDWNAVGEHTEALPIMKTDISMELQEQKFIIDTKFYQHGLINFYGSDKIRSNHLYQLYAYLQNDYKKRKDKAIGILLYPRVNQSYSFAYDIHQFTIRVESIDLDQNWQKIEDKLKRIIFF